MIPAVVLAAGLSTRMGGAPKALLTIPDGRTFVESVVDTLSAAGVPDVVVVLGHEGDAIAERLRRTRPLARVVLNDAYRSGQFSSVLAGLDAIDRPGVTAMLMTLVDVPLVSPSTVRAVLQRFSETHAPIVRPIRGDDHGHPVLIARSLFDEVRRADPAFGLKPIVRAHASIAGDVPITDLFAFRDVDTPADHAAIATSTDL